jgi:hypothetical protein
MATCNAFCQCMMIGLPFNPRRVARCVVLTVLEKRPVNPGTGKFRRTGTCKKYWCTIYSGIASDKKIMKNMTYRVRSSRFGIQHACMSRMRCIPRDSTPMHARTAVECHSMSWPAVLKELLAAKHARVAPRCRAAWPLCWPQTALRQQRSSCLLCKTEPTPVVPHLTQALLSRF